MTDDDDAGSLEGFQDDQAWSDAEREHQRARHRRKKKANKPARDAESSSQEPSSRLKERLSHSNRQLQAMALQVKALGAVPVFVKRPESGHEKGNNSSDQSHRGRNKIQRF